jgi:hypothetical protein
MLALPACDAQRSDSTAQDRSTRADSPPADTVRRDTIPPEMAPWLALMAAGVDTTTTVEMWLKAHPGNFVSTYKPRGLNIDTYCRTATDSLRSGSRTWIRHALFVVPESPVGEALPEPADTPLRVCTLRALWLELPVADEPEALRAVAALRDHFQNALGDGSDSLAFIGFGTGSWRSPASWISGRRAVVAAARPGRSYPTYPTDSTTVIVEIPTAAVAISFTVGRDMAMTWRYVRETPLVPPGVVVAIARADSAVSRSGFPALVALRKIFDHHLDSANFDLDYEKAYPSPALDTLLDVILESLKDSASLSASQRSAAFLAVDVAVLLHAAAFHDGPEHIARRKRLEALGTKYQASPKEDHFSYTRSWGLRALEADSLGPSGRSAFAELLIGGWIAECSPSDIVALGEQALRAGQSDPMIHAAVAKAYADQYRGFSEDAEPDTMRLRESERLRAVEQFRQAHGEIRDTGFRRNIWKAAVDLMAGLPIHNSYYCFPH